MLNKIIWTCYLCNFIDREKNMFSNYAQYINVFDTSICLVGLVVECSPMGRETRVQSQVESYQRLKKMLLDISLLNTRQYKVRLKDKWSNLGKGVAPSPTLQYSRYWKGDFRIALDYSCQLYFLQFALCFFFFFLSYDSYGGVDKFSRVYGLLQMDIPALTDK